MYLIPFYLKTKPYHPLDLGWELQCVCFVRVMDVIYMYVLGVMESEASYSNSSKIPGERERGQANAFDCVYNKSQ